MSKLFPASFFQQNRRNLRLAVQSDAPIIVTANGLLQRNSDNTYPFAQDSHFWYLTGIELPDITLVIEAGKEYLIVPNRSDSRQAFDGSIDAAELTDISGVSTVMSEDDGWNFLKKALHSQKSYVTPEAMPGYVEHYGMYVNPARSMLAETIADLAPQAEAIDIRKNLARLRMIKQPAELQALQQAIDITNQSLLTLTDPDRFQTYHNEFEFEADLGREFRFRGAAGHSFSPIVAGGKQACTLHNVANAAPLTRGSLVVIDVGAEVSHYAADITRTKAYGTHTARQQQVFDAVLDVQTYALNLLRPGAMLKEYEEAIERYMGETLIELGLIKKNDRDSVRRYFPHATSHFLGLDVHDVGDYSLPLHENVVITCEPGIYIPEESIGVRIEDDVLITASGNVVLSAALPREL